MPKETFERLNSDKKKRIIDCAVRLFSQKKYSKVTVDEFVAMADISKGSFYQYFDDKVDLYKFIITNTMKKLVSTGGFSEDNIMKISCLDMLDLVYEQLKIFLIEKKAEMNIIENFFMDAYNNSEMLEMVEELRDQLNGIYEIFILKGQSEGIIDQELDIDFMKYILFDLELFFMQRYLKDFKTLRDEETLNNLIHQLKEMIIIGIGSCGR